MDEELEHLLADLLGSVRDHNAARAAGRIDTDRWQILIAKDLYAGHYAAYMLGRGTKDIGDPSRKVVAGIVGEQVDYLNAFAALIDKEGWRDSFGARAAMYVGSVKETFWRGRTFGLDLPYYPAQGTQCLTNCGCSWEIDYDGDPEYLNATARWKRGKNDSCETCVQRASVVIRFREGVQV